jgi:hypothetical protein
MSTTTGYAVMVIAAAVTAVPAPPHDGCVACHCSALHSHQHDCSFRILPKRAIWSVPERCEADMPGPLDRIATAMQATAHFITLIRRQISNTKSSGLGIVANNPSYKNDVLASFALSSSSPVSRGGVLWSTTQELRVPAIPVSSFVIVDSSFVLSKLGWETRALCIHAPTASLCEDVLEDCKALQTDR